MVLIWSGWLAALVLIPLLVALYAWELRRRRKRALRFSSLALVRAALPHARPRRHVPPALFLLGLASLVIALARPALISTYFTSRTTIFLVLDVSGSMSQSDIPPNRLAAAQEAALSFVRGQGAFAQIGIVSFSSVALLVQEPTTDQDQLEAAIRSLTLGDSTAIGSGMLEALEAIAQMHKKDLPPLKVMKPGEVPPHPSTQAKAREYAPEIIVLLTDGSSNSGPLPKDVAYLAASQGVRVYTIGYGPVPEAAHKESASGDPQKLIPNTGGGNDNKGDFNSFLLAYDAKALNLIAEVTGGETYTATSAGELEKVFAGLPIQKTERNEIHEISVIFVALGGLLAMAALALSALWHPLP